ncbi:MAG: metallophosphatase family protein [Candidatus Gastranaerophilales bacterium]|nr:metallophosphatase family protein [Candidatus Gastranaerophilales bacterium]
MIKVAVISDIHGNMEALESVLNDIDNSEINRLLILGDLAIMGSEPDKTVTFVKNLSSKYDVDIIQGNTDLFIVNDGLPNVPDFAKNAIQYSKDTLSKENIEFLKNLPSTKSIKIGETSILMTHGSPRKNDENILPGKSIDEIKPMLEGVNDTLILCGHTHLPAGYQIEKQTVVNVGSVGRPFTEDNKACYVILEIDETKKDSFSVEHRFISFDVQKSAEKLAVQPFEGAKYLAELLLKSSLK